MWILFLAVFTMQFSTSLQAQSFTEAYAGSLKPVSYSSVAYGDYDNDGDLDILLTGYNADSSTYIFSKIYQNTGSGFTEVYAGSLTGVASSSVAWGDYDNDGDLDILLTGLDVANVPSSKIYQNTGSGFTEVFAGSLTPVAYSSVAWGDYDNDGDLDIVLTGYNSSYIPISKIYQNTGSGFTEVFAGSLSGVSSGSVAWGDFDNDSDLDILLTGYSGPGVISKIYQNTGSGFSEVYAGSLTAVQNSSVACGDYDNDGDLDILLTGASVGVTGNSKIYQNTGSGFTEVFAGSLTGVSDGSVAWGDYDYDGDLDILLTGKVDFNIPISKIYQNTGSGFTEVFTGNLLPVGNSSVTWGDHDNDGDFDILLTGGRLARGYASKIYQITGSGFTEVFAGSLTPVGQSSSAWGDYDNDGDLDILLTGYNEESGTANSRIYQNTGSGFTEVHAGSLTGVADGSAAWGDYDNDGDLDILLTGNDYSTGVISKIYQNTGSGFIEVFPGSLTPVAYSSVAWGDYDNDGDLDIVLTGYNSSYIPISKIYQNTGSGFTEVYAGSLMGVSYSSVTWGDYDNDGDLDILLTGLDVANVPSSKIYQNTGSGFTEVFAGSLTEVSISSVAWGDYDNDGDLDILVTGASQTAAVSKIYQNTGGGFTEVYAGSLPGVFYSSVAWGDYDNDGDLDILITGYDGNTEVHISKIYQNTGIGFTEAFEANLVAVQQGSVAWGDYDNDGDLDILLTGGFDYSGNDYDTQYAKIYRNSTIPPFNLSQQNEATFNVGPTAPTGLTATRSGNSISFKWNRATDPNTPSPGLTYNLRIGTTANGVNVQSPMADVASGYRRVVRMGNTNHDTSWTIHNLDTTQTYYWSVQALNHSSGSSAFFPEKTFAFTYTLTANATNGSISRSPDQPSYNSGSQVIVSATPATGYNFVNWSGDLSGSENPDTLTMDANKTVTANFAINTYSLSVSGDYGAVTKDPNQESFDHGTTAQVSQTADRGYIFTGWSGDATGTDNPLTVMMDGNKSIQANYEIDPDYENLYRTAKYETWALAKDGKNKLLSVKRKADKVFFKFNLVADSTRILYLEFPAEASGAITFGKLKTDTLVNFTTTKKKFRDTLMTISMGDTIQVDGVAKQGKKVQVKYAWGKAKAVTMKADSLYKINHVGLPMPNLHNIGEELFPKGFGQANAYFANGLLVGIPQGLKKANSVIHPKYADVQKSFVKGIKNGNRLHSDSLTARCLDSLDGTKKKAMSSQQKSLPPDKMDNKLFAEVLTLKLNIAASATEKFPAGIGQLTFDDPSNGSNPFNEMMVDSIVIKADSMLSCLNTSTGATLSELYETVQLINCAFADTTIDTLSFGSKTKFTGVKSLFEVDYLQPTPGIPPRIVQTFAEISDVVPERFELSQNYPNPFNPSTVIRYSLPVNSRVTLKMYDMLGREVASLVNEMQDAGFKMLEWNVGSLPSGIYFYRLTATGVEDNSRKFVEVNKMILLK